MDPEFWKAATMLLCGVVVTMAAAVWSVNRRPTFTQVEQMIARHESGSCYAKERRVIEEKLSGMAQDIAKLDRHFELMRVKVEEIHLDVETRRRVRIKAEKSAEPG